MKSNYSPSSDPLFYFTVALFAVISTALPAMIGLSRVMPLLQAGTLAVFIALAVRRGRTQHAVGTMIVWIGVQIMLVALLTWVVTDRMETAITGGFEERGAILEWYFSNRPFPGSLTDNPSTRLLELAGVTVGSLVSAGLIGEWFLARAVNLAGFHGGALMAHTDGATTASAIFALVTLLRLAGLAGIVILCTEPLLTGTWSPAYYWSHRRRLIVISLGLLILGLALEALVV